MVNVFLLVVGNEDDDDDIDTSEGGEYDDDDLEKKEQELWIQHILLDTRIDHSIPFYQVAIVIFVIIINIMSPINYSLDQNNCDNICHHHPCKNILLFYWKLVTI